MQGLKSSLCAIGLILIVFTMNMALPNVGAEEGGTLNGTENVRDGRIISVLTTPDQTYERTWTLNAGEWTSVTSECDQCTVTLNVDGVNLDASTPVAVQASQNGSATLTITSPVSELVSYSLIETIDEANPTLRPSPGESIASQPAWRCEHTSDCSMLDIGLEAIPSTEFTEEEFLLGVLENGQAEYIAVPVSAGETLELQILHATADIEVDVFMQTDTEVHLNRSLAQPMALETNTRPDEAYWHAEEQGRFILKVSSQSPTIAFAIKQVVHASTAASHMVNLSQQTMISGYHEATVIIETTDTATLNVQALHRNVTVQIQQLVDGTWLTATQVVFDANHLERIYPYPNASAFQIEMHGERFAIEVGSTDFSDTGTMVEAPSQLPASSVTSNASWPSLGMDTDPVEGELTLAIHDTADVYRIEINGYEDSVYLIQVKLMSSHLEHLQLDMWEIDQALWEAVDTRNAQIINGKIVTALELTPGTHFVRVSHVDVVNATNHTWGSQVTPVKYMISTASEMIEEGYPPYFPPDDETVKWGEVARWFMGLLFLAPCAYFAVIFSSNRKRATEMSLKTEQLAWFKQQMDSGEAQPNTLRKSLDKSLQAIAQLDWSTACTTWGPPDGQHRTEGIAMAAWVLDQRLAKKENGLPIMVGVHVLKGNWELAALRLDAPEGQPWEVVNVEPRFLHRGEEIFLDTMREGNITFLTLEISGPADAVDVELNGRSDGQPMAARMPQALLLNAQNEE